MKKALETEVAVIGGGVTGTGILRDLALRGIKAVLVEQGDLGHGTSTRNHGLLHSGCRYAVRDPEAAVESYQENLILKRTIPGSIEQTGGLFVKVPGDDDAYVRRWLDSCGKLGIPVGEIPLEQAFREEPYLTKEAQAVYQVPDGTIDDFTLLIDVAADAVAHGAALLTYHEVTGIMTEQNHVSGIHVRDTRNGEEQDIYAPIVINAAGPWGMNIAKMAGVPLRIINNKGMLVVFSHRFNKRVINRLRMPGDGDIFVPAHDVTIFGTTGKNTDDPNDFSLNREEMEQMLTTGADLIPEIHQMRLIRAYSGSRPLYQKTAGKGSSGRDVTRGMALLDHGERDGLDGLITITGGKLTTFRLMAERTVDLVCKKLGSDAQCTTREAALPSRKSTDSFSGANLAPAARHKLMNWAGVRTPEFETSLKDREAANVVCECEQVTWAEIDAAIPGDGHLDLGDIRRRTRLGMGPCQGTFCNFRTAALAVEHGKAGTREADCALMRGVKERRKGMGVVATGETAKQLQLMQTIYQVSLGFGNEEEKQHV
ncbi:anaerobic glycerol-3-phosphate dehydrogenase subunit GlpA [Sporolactobacillus vineae]|uniref:anaerobic glycerol-3-phosphate dehydrogenase subunit GlpA n=1 Tax=Sporolactobacillus vineae TaxID=444463 RepID=UPI0002895ECC|nr:anaerobic glycerol-3-phosphate dehydrogenase subunit GlpA [Sporolactobacillus vineae]